MLYVLCYPELEPAAAEAIAAFRRSHEPERAALVGPHVTLVFGAEPAAADALGAECAAIAADSGPFAVTLDGLTVHADPERGEWKLLLGVREGRDAFAAWHRRLYAAVQGQLSARAYDPHVTIATALAPGRIDVAREEARRLALPMSGRIGTITVVTLEAGRLVPRAGYALAGPAPAIRIPLVNRKGFDKTTS